MKTLVKTKKPIIAAVDGVAVGIGFTMLLHCDIVFMTPNARLRLPFVDLGIVPEAGSSRLLPERIGIQRASELLLTGRFVEANEAAQLGFANEIVPTDQIEAKAASMAALLAAKPRTALLQSRALIRSNTSDLIDLIDREFDAFGIALASAETQALLAQMQKPRT